MPGFAAPSPAPQGGRDYYKAREPRRISLVFELLASLALLDYRVRMSADEVRARIANVPQWFDPVRVRPRINTPGTNDAQAVLRMLDLSTHCHGMRALAPGTRCR